MICGAAKTLREPFMFMPRRNLFRDHCVCLDFDEPTRIGQARNYNQRAGRKPAFRKKAGEEGFASLPERWNVAGTSQVGSQLDHITKTRLQQLQECGLYWQTLDQLGLQNRRLKRPGRFHPPEPGLK